MSEADRMWEAAIGIAKAFTESPMMKAYYKAYAKEQAAIYAGLVAAAKCEQEAIQAAAEKKRRDRAYDMGGCGDACTRFGIMDGCKPHCPVFMDGDCPIQAENEEAFMDATHVA